MRFQPSRRLLLFCAVALALFLAPLAVGAYPTVPSDCSNRTALVPRRARPCAQIILHH